jgi:hypothetical protein
MDIPALPPSSAPEVHIPPNVPALRQALKHTLDHVNRMLSEVLDNPDHINTAFCAEFSKKILSLQNLATEASHLTKQDTDFARTMREAGTIIDTILKAPIYVEVE